MLEWTGSYALEPHLAELINQASTLSDRVLLVLDDYHLITAPAVHQGVSFLLEHLPGNMHLVLATRGDPPLSLARLRARGELTELRQSDLRFTPEEAATFLNDVAGLGLAPREVTSLEARTEGWIAGLRLASLAVEGWKRDSSRGLSDSIQQFTGSHRFILDYLVEEVLEQQSPTVQRFLLETSILERLCGPLCDAVRFERAESQGTLAEAASISPEPVATDQSWLDGLSPSQQILEYLENANLFIVPLDDERRWYRYHRLFSDLLRKRLQQSPVETVQALHRRASEWFEQEGTSAAAIEHVLDAGDMDRAASLIEGTVEATFMRSEVVTILRWVERLPDDLLRNKPTLCFYHAWALLMSGRSVEAVEREFLDSTCDQDGDLPGEQMGGRLAALRAYSLLLQGDMPRSAMMSAQALDHLPDSDQFLRSVMAWIQSLARLFEGDLLDGGAELAEVVRIGQELGNPLIAVTALCYQARLQSRQGRLYRARETLERALLLAADGQGRRLPIASEPLIGLGELWREWNDFDTALEHLTEAIDLAAQWSEVAALDAYGPLARIRAAQGDWKGAQEALERARKLALRSESTDVDDRVVELQQAHLLAMQGDLNRARRWAEKRGLNSDPCAKPAPEADQTFVDKHLLKYEQGVFARVLILEARLEEALSLLDVLLAEARDLDRTDLIIDLQILRALAFEARNDDSEAISALAEALRLAEPGTYIRVFVDEGQAMAALLRRAASRGVSPTYVVRLLEAFEDPGREPREGSFQPRPQPLIEPLSEREIEVLQLLARGMSNPEIAQALFIAVSTVRSHCKSIYAKLEVHKRWDAVQRAQELNLL
jgi:LuxR family maltose regulon positive regulatory protein